MSKVKRQRQPSEELAHEAMELIASQPADDDIPGVTAPFEKAEAETAPPVEPETPKAVKGKDLFSDGFNKGFAHGFAKGKELGYEAAFADGVHHIVTLAENFLVKELKLPGREALVNSGKILAWWTLALMTNFIDGRRGKKGDEHHD